jgi:hypothetical protein
MFLSSTTSSSRQPTEMWSDVRNALTICARRAETRPVGRSESDPLEGGSFYALLL